MNKNAIIFFDGICNFCNSSVNFIIKEDKKNYFKFASLQSEFAKKFFESYNLITKVHLGDGNNPSRSVSSSLRTLGIDPSRRVSTLSSGTLEIDSSRRVSTLSGGTLETKQFEIIQYPDSIILFENKKFHIKSTAALKIAKHLNGFWKIFFIFILIPPFIRNLFYDIIAKNRYKWFGKRDTCMLPDEKIREKFLN